MEYEQIIKLAEALSEHINRSEATLSNKIFGHARFFSRLRKGCGCTAHKLREGMQWFSANWPEDLEWPREIPRPKPNPKEAA